MNIREFLQSKLVSDLPVVPLVIEIDSETPIHEAFSTLLVNGILSAPVYDAKASKYLGYLDVRELTKYVSAYHRKTVEQERKHMIQEKINVDMPRDLLSSFSNSKTESAVTLKYLARMMPMNVTLTTNDTLLDVVTNLPIKHRLPVVNDQGRVINIISQSTVIQFLRSQEAKFQTILDVLVQDAKIHSSPAYCVPASQPFIESLNYMANKGLSGVGVVDEDGKMLMNMSASDLKLWLALWQRPEARAKLLANFFITSPTSNFLVTVRQGSYGGRMEFPVVFVKPTATIGKALRRLAATKIHRVFVCDDKRVPLGVLSLSDLIRYLLANLDAPLDE